LWLNNRLNPDRALSVSTHHNDGSLTMIRLVLFVLLFAFAAIGTFAQVRAYVTNQNDNTVYGLNRLSIAR